MSRIVYLFLFALSFPLFSATPVILISVDTLRADHLSCDQGRVPTPNICSLTKNGTLFSQISSPYPLTLPAHTALFTSTYPFSNGVRDNGIPLSSPAVTLATVLKQAGYQTAAFVASFVLDRRFGLSRGFDIYDAPVDLHNKATPGVDRKRPGAQVAEAATRWLANRSSTPWFLFLHLYDLHEPYDLPPDPAQRHGETGYAAELTYVDHVLGDFLATLDRRGLLDKTLIVLTSDHGEGLGDHGESSHGFFIYQSTLHVPLIVHWPAGAYLNKPRIPAARVDEPAGLLDVAPTILDALGIARPVEMRGRSLLAPHVDEEVYSESTYARNHFGCATLRSLRVGTYKYIDATRPELYNLAADSGELHNLYDQQKAKATAMAERISAIRASAPARKAPSPSPETISVLRSLGYLSGSTNASRVEPHVDPKDRIGDFERYVAALVAGVSGRLAESDGVLETLRDKMPDLVDIRTNLGLNYERQGHDAPAAREFKRAVELDPQSAPAHFDLGSAYFRLHQPADAIKQFQAALAIEPWYTRADEALAELYIQNKDYPEARARLKHLLSVDPASYTAHFNLGVLAAIEQNWSEAQQHLQAATRADPASAQAHYNLAMVLQKLGKTAEAAKELRAADQAQH